MLINTQTMYVNPESNQKPTRVLPSDANSSSNHDESSLALLKASRIAPQKIYSPTAETIAGAEAMFSRENSYADLSGKVQKSLQAYESVEMSAKREVLSELMGVDLYA